MLAKNEMSAPVSHFRCRRNIAAFQYSSILPAWRPTTQSLPGQVVRQDLVSGGVGQLVGLADVDWTRPLAAVIHDHG